MKYPRSFFRKSPSSLAFHQQRSRELRYVWAVTLVALGLLVGFILQPSFGRSQAYATFYPVVLLCAYVLGPRPAALAAVLSAAIAYWCFIPPAFQWKWDAQVGSALAFFLGTSAVAIHLVSWLTGALAKRPAHPANLARVNAVIFADLAARQPQAGTSLAMPKALRVTSASWAARPSERSFDVIRLDREAGSAAAAQDRAASRAAETPAEQRTTATLH